MNVIRRKIIDKIDHELSYGVENIVRIELTIEEFKKVCREFTSDDMKYVSHVDINNCDVKFASVLSVLDDCCLLTPQELSGSFIVYKGAYLQTHTDYK